jgi:16S rRNA (cytidine1402-2'-O)-methyltransferase
VGTPIGNLGDLTLRAIETLQAADHIVAEDTRRARALLSHLGIREKRVTSLDANASAGEVRALVDRVLAGERVALVTDAGMPGVSDPGVAVVREATERGASVSVAPGPSAVTAAVALSGLVDGPFTFLGFLPRKGEKRREALALALESLIPVVLFEAPGRTGDTLKDLAELAPERPACVARELTKLHEEVARGRLAELAEREEWLGEVVIVVDQAAESTRHVEELDLDQAIRSRLENGLHVREIASELAEKLRLPRRTVYARAELLKRANEG